MRILLAALVVLAQAGPRPKDPESPVHPRRFGSPGGEKFSVRVFVRES